jgi:hypothetical protein
MTAQISELLSTPDNVEKIRDMIAYILKLELTRQYEFALDAGLADAEDYRVAVYLEANRPWQSTEMGGVFPLVDVQLMEYKPLAGNSGSSVSRKNYTAQFAIDCYARGRPDAPDHFDDADATIRAWKVGRVVRSILMAGQYTYLGMRDVVSKREIVEAQTGRPSDATMDDSAVAVTVCRLVLAVDFYEDSPQAAPTELEGMTFTAVGPGGMVLFGART